MQRIPISQLNQSTIEALTSTVEVCSDAGTPLGLFVPAPAERLPGEPDFDWGALRKELPASPAGLNSLQQIWANLGAR